MADLPQRIAIVYDRVTKWGGAEQVLLALHELFPTAPLFTSVSNSKTASWSKVFPQIIPTFLQRFPFIVNHHEYFPWLMPLAFESLKFDNYDAVISVTSAEAKDIITSPTTFHLCYCLTPTRYLWSHEKTYSSQISPIFKPLFNYMKFVDCISCQRPDKYVAISNTIKERITKFYRRDSMVIYPPVGVDKFTSPNPGKYFLWIGRLVAYKQPDKVIRLFNKLNLPLLVIGEGHRKNYLKSIAKSNIKITGFVPEDELVNYLQNCKALISMHEEDFGINYVEAQAAGKPILGLNIGAVTEIVTTPQTGTLVNSEAELEHTIKNFDSSSYSSKMCQANAKRFSKQRFLQNFAKVFQEAWQAHKNTYMS